MLKPIQVSDLSTDFSIKNNKVVLSAGPAASDTGWVTVPDKYKPPGGAAGGAGYLFKILRTNIS